MKLLILPCLLFSLSFCLGQQSLPNDWELKELKGKVRRVIENESYHNPASSPLKKILNFDRDGFLKTVSEYNDYYVEDDSVSLSHILYYKNDSDRRYFSRYDLEKNDTVVTGFYQTVKKGEYLIKTKTSDGYSTTMNIFMIDKNITQHTYVVYDSSNIKLADLTMSYEYKDDELFEIHVVENVKKSNRVLTVESIKDSVGNVINQIYFNEDGKMYYELKRKIYYYD
ncbi:hypothetical protein [uncultured Psychroserpens sp.]|uniref:hypothetical protein n=1 Tax=uncultured Psychroserpens sp. TaxID=255436 RepID=UPI00261B7A18|nr:hypothetical protein [uncultured Psychroserpens sp.]